MYDVQLYVTLSGTLSHGVRRAGMSIKLLRVTAAISCKRMLNAPALALSTRLQLITSLARAALAQIALE